MIYKDSNSIIKFFYLSKLKLVYKDLYNFAD